MSDVPSWSELSSALIRGAPAYSGAEAHSGGGTAAPAGGDAVHREEPGAGATATAGRTAITMMYSFWAFRHRSSSLLMKKNGPDWSNRNRSAGAADGVQPPDRAARAARVEVLLDHQQHRAEALLVREHCEPCESKRTRLVNFELDQ